MMARLRPQGKAGADSPLRVQQGQERALKKTEELLLKFRPKRQYQPQVTHLSFVYCLYYVNTFFGKYFCFYFIIKFRNLTRRAVASLAPRGAAGLSPERWQSWRPRWPGMRPLGRDGGVADPRGESGPPGLPPCLLWGAPRSNDRREWRGEGPGKGSQCERGGGPPAPPRARPGRLRAFPPRWPLASAESRPRRTPSPPPAPGRVRISA